MIWRNFIQFIMKQIDSPKHLNRHNQLYRFLINCQMSNKNNNLPLLQPREDVKVNNKSTHAYVYPSIKVVTVLIY